MALSPSAWLRSASAVYLDNATSRRDYRVQLRGNKSVVLFGAYLVFLIGSAMLAYSSSVHSSERQEIVEAQASLRGFYTVVTMLLASLVSLVAPALTATTVVSERIRRSFDLVFSAPVTPRYYLVGKMMSSFRYTWMLLILALPITAVCVVLGGATWQDVIVLYALLSFQALIMTSIGLLLSTLAPRAVSAILWSYAASIVYLLITYALSFPILDFGFGRGPQPEQPFLVALNPFMNQFSTGTYTMVFGHQISNWILVGIFSVLISKICLLGAGVMLSPRPDREITSLRIHALTYVGLIVGYGSYGLTNGLWMSAGSVKADMVAHGTGVMLFGLLTPLVVFLPFISCFGLDGDGRFRPDGWFSPRHALDGRPSGGLVFLLGLILVTAGALLAGISLAEPKALAFDYPTFFTWVFFIAAFWTAFWAIGRLTSSFFIGLKGARTLQFASFILVIALPMIVLAIVTGASPDSSDTLWVVYPLHPLFASPPDADRLALIWAGLMAVMAALVAGVAEVRTREKLKSLKEKHEAGA